MLEIKSSPTGLILKIYLQPKSSHNQIAGVHGEALKVKISSPPVGGAANKMCIQFLAKQMGLPKSSLEIVSGHASRNKRILVKADPENQPDLRKMIHSLLD